MGIANYKIIKDYILGKSSSVNLSKLLDWMNESDKNEEILFREDVPRGSAVIPSVRG